MLNNLMKYYIQRDKLKYFSIFIIATAIVLCTACNIKSQELPLHNKRVLILGNSITQNGQYVDFMEYYLRKEYPKQTLDIISIGLSSETISGDSEPDNPFPRPWLYKRLENALDLTKPDLVLACYGMNDGIYSEKDSTRFNNYKNGIKNLTTTLGDRDIEIILLTPTPFDPDPAKERLVQEGEPQSYKNPYHKYAEVLSAYSDWLVSLDGIKVVNLNSYLNEKLENIKAIKTDSTFVPDAVHPNSIGHYYMAEKVLKDLYPSIAMEANVLSELNRLSNDSLFIVVSKRRQTRSKGWLDYIGYTRNGKTVKSNNIEQTIKSEMALDAEIKKLLED